MLNQHLKQWARSTYAIILFLLILQLFSCFIQNGYAVCDIETNGRNFQCKNNGPRFFWMGDTAWSFSTSDLPCATASCNSGAFADYIQERAAQGFNILQGNIFHYPESGSSGEDVKGTNENGESPFCKFVSGSCGTGQNCRIIPEEDWDYDCPNNAYHTNVKARIEYMNENHDIIAAIAPGWGANFNCSSIPGQTAPAWTKSQIENYYDYLAGFFGNASPNLEIVWLVTSNTDSTGPGGGCNLTWQQLANRISNIDTDHLITIHPGIQGDAPGGYDIAQLQKQPCTDPTPVTEESGTVPVVDGEFNYEVTQDCWDQKTGADCANQNFPDNVCIPINECFCDASCKENHHTQPDTVLYGAWSIIMRGGYFTYGNAATYYNWIDKTEPGESACINSKISTAALDMTELYEFFNNNGYRPVEWNNASFGPIDPPDNPIEDDKLVMAEIGNQYVLYAKTAGNFDVLNSINDSGAWEYRSYNIKSGNWTSAANTYSGEVRNIPNRDADTVTLVTKLTQLLDCPSHFTISPGTSVDLTCTLTMAGQFSGTISFSCPNITPSGSGITCSGMHILDQTTEQANVTITAPTNAIPGAYSVEIRALPQGQQVPETDSTLINARGYQCDGLNNDPPPAPADWDYRPPMNQSNVWQYVNNDALKATTFKKGTIKPILGTHAFTSCSICSIEASVKAEIPMNGAKKFITLYGWWDPADKQKRVELKLDYQNDLIKLTHKTPGPNDRKRKAFFDLQEGVSYLFRVSFNGTSFNVWKDGVQIQELTFSPKPGEVPYGIPAFVVKGTKQSSSAFSGELDYIDVCYGCLSTCTDMCGCNFVAPKTPNSGDQFSGTSSSSSQVSIQNVTIVEGSGDINYAAIKLNISPANSNILTLDYSTSNGTAVSGQDFLAESGTTTIEAKQSVKVITIPIISDFTIEGNETFTVTLSNLSQGGSFSASQATITIQDDDTPEEDDEPDSEFEIDCPSQFSLPKDDIKTMSCGVILYDFLSLSTDIAWNCNNSSSVACTFQPQGISQLNVGVDPGSSTPVGDITNFTIRGVVETVTQSDVLNLRVVNFQHTCPDPITVVKGSFTDSPCTVGQSSNWTDSTLQINWSCSGLPSGASCIFTPNPWNVNGGSTVNLRIQTTTGTPTGNYNITVTGTSGQQVRTDSVLLKVVTQTTYTFYPIGDSFVKGIGQNENEGLTTHMRIQHPTHYSHVVLKFSQSNILSTIGTKEIVSANLKLYIETNFNNWGSGSSVDVHRMTASWEERITTNPAQGVTWNCPVDTNLGNSNPNCATQWSGGSYSSTILNTQLHQNNQTGWKTFSITSDLQAIQGGTTHYGWLLRKRNSTDQGSVDYTSIQGSASFKPRLEVTVND